MPSLSATRLNSEERNTDSLDVVTDQDVVIKQQPGRINVVFPQRSGRRMYGRRLLERIDVNLALRVAGLRQATRHVRNGRLNLEEVAGQRGLFSITFSLAIC